MLALIIAHPGAVRDGLVALLEAAPEISKILQVEKVKPAWDFVQVKLATFIAKLVGDRISPILAIVESEEDRHTAVSQGADVVVMAGLPPAKLKNHITTLLHKDSETRRSKLLEGDIK